MRAADLIGKEIKGFKVLDWKRKNNRTYLLVICPYCKKEKWMRKDRIDDPKTKSCGCLSKQRQFKARDLSGKTFGRLKAVAPTSDRGKNGCVIWECVCECGNAAFVSEKDLQAGAIKSCGCLGIENSQKNGRKAGAYIKKEYCVAGTNVNNLTQKIKITNKSGVKGVCWDKHRNKWIAQIGFQGHNYRLGRYDNIEDAEKARKEAEENIFGSFLDWYYETYPEKRRK